MAGSAVFPTFVTLPAPGLVLPGSTGSAQFRGSYNMANEPNLHRTQQKVIAIVNLILQCKSGAIGVAADYSVAGGHNKLIQDAGAFTSGIGNFNLLDALDTLFVPAGQVEGGGSFSADITTILNTGKDFLALPEETLDRIIALLLYRTWL